jgi:Glycosyl hydrolases family 2, sugar binding domain/Glycosyl hydrolases family 2, TIM barrel domain/Glycosyl hydrolases family 2
MKHTYLCPKPSVLAGASLALLLFAPLPSRAVWQAANGPLKTRWAKDVSPANAHPEYPRPQMVRKDWLNLNGLWDFGVAGKDATRATFNTQILVPFPPESALSGVMRRVSENDRLWYRRTFVLPGDWRGRRLLLHFGAVDYEATVWLNGQEVGRHRGGYDAFSFDVTEALKQVGQNELIVAAWDPTDAGTQPRGKQVRKPGGIFYTSTSGIWQTVWLEPVNAAYITDLKIVPDVDNSAVMVDAVTTPMLGAGIVEVIVRDGRKPVYTASITAGGRITMPVKNARLWSPEDPHLYSLVVTLKLGGRTLDKVESYFGMRKISLGKDAKGFTRLMLNNKPCFQFGPLDQGFWPDGLYTAPTDEALRYDIEMTKKLGFNMARKHVKVEPERWYYWCDKLGLLVWQDMPSGDKFIGGKDPDITRSPESGKEYEQELTAMVQGHANHPCIVMWVPYNEGWGQWDTPRIVAMIKKLDPARLVDDASGWTDRGVGDVNDMHKYPGPGSPEPEESRAVVLGEFGGLGLPVSSHTWQSQKNWGYRSFTDAEALTTAYVDLVEKLFPLIGEKGLSAAVYTQTTDVEVEVNGLMTYDRAMVKMNLDKVAAANHGHFPPRAKTTELVPTALTERVTWRWTQEKPAQDWAKPGFDASSWKEGRAGFGTKGTPGAVVRTEWSTSDIWLRREFSIQAGKTDDLRLLIHHDEDAEVYINGVLAAGVPGFTVDYEKAEINLPAKATLKPAGNVMAVHCHQTAGGQYIDAGIVKVEVPKWKAD